MVEVSVQIVTSSNRYKKPVYITPKGAVLHSIGVTQPSAQKLRNSWQSNGSDYVTHYTCDDKIIIQTMPENHKCWHVGSPGNDKWIGLEMGEPDSIVANNPSQGTGSGFKIKDRAAAEAYVTGAYNNAVALFAQLCKKYGWNPYTDIWTHGEISKRGLSNTNHIDPEHIWKGLGMPYTMDTFRKDVAAKMNGADPAPQPEPAKPVQPVEEQIYRIRKSWEDAASQIGAYSNLDYAIAACVDGYAVFDKDGKQIYPEKIFQIRVTASVLNIRKGPGTQYPVVNAITHGGAYTIVEEKDGWGLLKSYEAARDGWISLKYTEPI